ncbi:MAG: translation initiation factor IF-2 [Candidatus Woesearchaeota archaeon]
MECRMPICSVLGHVDHGKSSILDNIRRSSIVNSEPGAITQAIGASIVPLTAIQRICGNLLEKTKMKFIIPGLLFIDTPGHAAFTSLRKRGGNIADIAILVVDVNEGFKPQTKEAVEILKAYKTPFIVAANKIDIINGWRHFDENIIKNINQQDEKIREEIDKKIYEVVGSMSELGFNSERFDRVENYTKQIAIIPTSAKTSEGIPELLMVLIGLTQKYLEEELKCDTSGNAKGTILEVKEEKGIGCCLDVIIYDGHLSVNDTIVIGHVDKPIITKVRGLFEPAPLKEMRDKKTRFLSVKRVNAATGVRIYSPDLKNVIAGMPIMSCKENEIEQIKNEIKKEVEESIIETQGRGIIIKADSLGSLEAMIKLLKEKNVNIRKASVGNITKNDITDAESNYEKNPIESIILGFNIKNDSGIINEKVKVIVDNVIYRLIENYEKWKKEKQDDLELEILNSITKPCKIEFLKNYAIRMSNPAIIGIEVLSGILKVNMPLMKNDGKEICRVKSMQKEKETVNSAVKGEQLAISLPGITIGRQIQPGEILYSALTQEEFRQLRDLKKYLSNDEIETIKEILLIMRKIDPVWGV